MSNAVITEEHLKGTCNIGQGELCCKYLTFSNGFECAKLNPSLRAMIDARTNMKAKGDNCPGKPDELAEFLNS